MPGTQYRRGTRARSPFSAARDQRGVRRRQRAARGESCRNRILVAHQGARLDRTSLRHLVRSRTTPAADLDGAEPCSPRRCAALAPWGGQSRADGCRAPRGARIHGGVPDAAGERKKKPERRIVPRAVSARYCVPRLRSGARSADPADTVEIRTRRIGVAGGGKRCRDRAPAVAQFWRGLTAAAPLERWCDDEAAAAALRSERIVHVRPPARDALGVGTKIGIAAGAVCLAVLPILACYGARGC